MTVDAVPSPSDGAVVYVVDVCGTLVRDDTTLGLLRHHFARDKLLWVRRSLFAVMTARRSPFRLLFALLEKVTGRHLLKHAVVHLLRGVRVAALDQSAAEYSAYLLSERRVAAVRQVLGSGSNISRVVLASASLEPVVAKLATALGADYVSSTLEQRAGVLTGCFSADLTGRKQQALVSEFGATFWDEQVIAISDNFSDRSLLEKASQAYVVLHREAHLHRWAGLNATFLRLGE